MTVAVTVIMVLRREPQARVDRALAAVAGQAVSSPLELVIAAPAADRARLRLPANAAVVDNPSGGRSAGLNIAADAASGDVICRVDARSVPPVDYVSRCVERLATDPSVGVVGAVQRPVAFEPGAIARGIARALANPWALGGAPYRRLGRSGSVDTVYLGAYRAAELRQIGGFDEALDANEDFELCQRYRAAGWQVWLEPGLVVDYEARADLPGLWRQYHDFGRAKVRFWRLTGGRPNARQSLALGAGALGTAAVASRARHPRSLTTIASVAAAGLALLDHVAEPTERDMHVRATAAASSGLISAAWLSGVAREAVFGDR